MDRLNLPLSQLGPKLLALPLLVAALLWGAWITQQVTSSPEQRIVTVRLAETIGTFVEEAARADADPAVVQAASLAYLKAAESAVADMGHDGRVVLVAEAVLAGAAEDATSELEQRIADKLAGEKQP
ncbi:MULTISPECIES: TrbI F-type domain-containing protein [Erythrobacteraceae]|uniref:Type-F conjugative transfer system protein TrbI n=1 Tax=Qipengyuania polymorpha TaxID=2867234 RepID=A0ABS7IXK4_9SPHN|nr:MULTISPECIES: TrbI F-type domain-containing protein [Erythrobacteraceae]MBX7457005.1 type-F conjugative transfer system protein TrbI [Qipengyuania polymorpha]QFT77547.1 Type-F conjugative transfer system protein [Erythrobacter sp. THAF29]